MEQAVLRQALGIDVANNSVCFQKITDWLSKLNIQKDNLIVVMEATGVYHELLAVYLHQKG